jgi:hypothetical protein
MTISINRHGGHKPFDHTYDGLLYNSESQKSDNKGVENICSIPMFSNIVIDDLYNGNIKI